MQTGSRGLPLGHVESMDAYVGMVRRKEITCLLKVHQGQNVLTRNKTS